MDVSALSVSIDVDMSGFIDSMEQLSAILSTVAEEFADAAKGFKGAFSDINNSGEDSKNVWAQVIDFVKEVVEIFTTLKEIIQGATAALRYLGIVSEDATATSLLGGLLELVGVSAELATPIGWLILGISSLGLAYEALYGSSKKANNEITKTDDAKGPDSGQKKLTTQGNAGSNPQNTSQYKQLDNPNNIHFDSSRGLSDGSGGDSGSNTTNSSSGNQAPNNSSVTTTNEANLQATDDFVAKAKAKYEELKEAFPPKNADIKVKVDVLNIQQLDDVKKQLAEVKEAMDEMSKIPGKMNSPEYDQLKQKYAQLTAQINSTAQATKAQAAGQKLATDMIADSAKGIGDSIAAMALGEKSNPLAAIMSSLAGALSAYAMILITTGTSMLLTGDPAGGAKLAEGTGLEAVAGIIKGLSAKKFATGGIVSGSTFANIGEYAGASHNPEVVAPLDKLRGMLGGGGNNMHYSFEMMGDKMVAALDRQSNNNNFVLGTSNQ